jgi:hypothetical protein
MLDVWLPNGLNVTSVGDTDSCVCCRYTHPQETQQSRRIVIHRRLQLTQKPKVCYAEALGRPGHKIQRRMRRDVICD